MVCERGTVRKQLLRDSVRCLGGGKRRELGAHSDRGPRGTLGTDTLQNAAFQLSRQHVRLSSPAELAAWPRAPDRRVRMWVA